jgi:hypothetical protein
MAAEAVRSAAVNKTPPPAATPERATCPNHETPQLYTDGQALSRMGVYEVSVLPQCSDAMDRV